jgi:hypothetical protein
VGQRSDRGIGFDSRWRRRSRQCRHAARRRGRGERVDGRLRRRRGMRRLRRMSGVQWLRRVRGVCRMCRLRGVRRVCEPTRGPGTGRHRRGAGRSVGARRAPDTLGWRRLRLTRVVFSSRRAGALSVTLPSAGFRRHRARAAFEFDVGWGTSRFGCECNLLASSERLRADQFQLLMLPAEQRRRASPGDHVLLHRQARAEHTRQTCTSCERDAATGRR